MGHLTYKAEKGAAGLLWFLIKFMLLLAFLFWPLAIEAHKNGSPSVLGIVLEIPWALIVGFFAFAAWYGRR